MPNSPWERSLRALPRTYPTIQRHVNSPNLEAHTREDDVEIHPASAERWNDLLALFGDNGAYSNCWCTWWLLTASAWDSASKTERRDLLSAKVHAGDAPGLLAYCDDEPVGWCAVGPRRWYGRMNSPRSRVYRPIDDQETWVINCFFIRKDRRGTGVATALLDAAVAHATARGAEIIEAYPVDRSAKEAGAALLFVGTLSMFEAAGFTEVARMGTRPLVRRRFDAASDPST